MVGDLKKTINMDICLALDLMIIGYGSVIMGYTSSNKFYSFQFTENFPKSCLLFGQQCLSVSNTPWEAFYALCLSSCQSDLNKDYGSL